MSGRTTDRPPDCENESIRVLIRKELLLLSNPALLTHCSLVRACRLPRTTVMTSLSSAWPRSLEGRS